VADVAEDITIVGAGLVGAAYLGAAADDALRTARVVFCSTTNAGIADHVRALNPAATVRVSEEGEYKPRTFRPDMYRRMADAVIDAARGGPGVVMLAPGSAVVVDRVTQLVLAGARAAGLRVRILPGVSSIESVLAELEYDVSAGLQVVLAQRLVLERVQLNPGLASLVLQPAYYDTSFFAGAPHSAEGRFDDLTRQLGLAFTPDAPMALVATATEIGAAASVLWFRLASLNRLHRVLSPRQTLFIPPERAPTTDDAFAARVASWDTVATYLEHDARGAISQQSRREIAGQAVALPPELREESSRLAERWKARPR
jgi:precorrin-6B methylase 1